MAVPLGRPIPRLRRPRPRPPAEHREPVVGWLVAARSAPVAKEIPGAGRRAGLGRERRAEPRVLGGRVVGHDIGEDLQAVGVRVLEQSADVVQRPEPRVDRAVVGDVVAAVHHRRRVPGIDPDGVGAERPDPGQAGPQPRDVPHPVAVRVGEAAQVDLVDDGAWPPCRGGAGRRERVTHQRPAHGRGRGTVRRAAPRWSAAPRRTWSTTALRPFAAAHRPRPARPAGARPLPWQGRGPAVVSRRDTRPRGPRPAA